MNPPEREKIGAMNIWAIIPARPLEEGKSRLASALSDSERLRLNETFFRQTLEIAASVVGRARTLAISRSPTMLRIAAGMGVHTMLETAPHGLNEALDQAAALAREQGAQGVLSLSCDLPFLTPDDIRALIAAAEDAAGLAIACDRAGTGTNALLVAPIGAIPYAYGPGSFAAHTQAAERAGHPIRIVRRAGLAFDVDAPDDLEQMEELGREHMRSRLHVAG
jgi:2-phospho-L-lactate guanylyltransferase